jgi:hypothetical protein
MTHHAGNAWPQPFEPFYDVSDLIYNDEALTRQTGKYAPDTLVRASEVQFAWMDDAACVGLDPDSFFPGTGDLARTVRKVCAGCPVRQRCLDFANSAGVSGIWGGTSEAERKRAKAA